MISRIVHDTSIIHKSITVVSVAHLSNGKRAMYHSVNHTYKNKLNE